MGLIKKLLLIVVTIAILVASFFLSIFILGFAVVLGLVVMARVWWLSRQRQKTIIKGEYRKLDD